MKREKEKGSITVEATLFIPLFLFAFLSIYNLIYFARAQLIIQYSANQAAKEVAQYSYLLEKTGILEDMDRISEKAGEMKADIKKIEENLRLVESAAENAAKSGDIIGNAVTVGENIEDAYGSVQKYVDSPEKFIGGVVSVLADGSKDALTRYMVSVVAKSCVQKRLSIASGGKMPEEYLEKLGVSGLDLSRTSWCKDKSRDIRIVVDYDITNRLPFFELAPRHYRVCASTRVWSGV